MAPHRNLTRDMTYGKPLPLILGFALPLIFGNLFQQLYSNSRRHSRISAGF